MAPAAYEIRAGGDGKSKKQSMADLKLRRLNELNMRLKEDLDRPRIKVSEASMSLIQYTNTTKDFMVPSLWGQYAQELLSTFSLSLGEVSLIPSTSGTFQIDIIHASPSTSSSSAPLSTPLWDRKTDGGFPETKILKQRVRDVIEPGRHLGHVDGKRETDAAEEGKKEGRAEAVAVEDGRGGGEAAGCEDCN
ncbi:hypothetical protein MMC20_005952 [Loxospora ochrophaea]|nr:hypothetical protein [Loxospora ochrophaea]